MRAIAIILSSLTGLLAIVTAGGLACTRTPGDGPFPVHGWFAVAACIAAVASIIVVAIATKR